jgi:hypothetical protein
MDDDNRLPRIDEVVAISALRNVIRIDARI